MSTVRLSVSIKESVERALIRYRFEAEAQQLIEDRAKLAEDVYNDVYNELEQKKMASLPKGWLPTRDDVMVRFGDTGNDDVTLAFNGAPYGVISQAGAKRVEAKSRMVPYCHQHGFAKVYDSGHALAERHVELKNRFGILEERIKEVKKVARSTMDSVTTVSALVKAWPEIKPFVERYMDAPAQLPALPRAHLNNLIGLPADEAKVNAA